VIDFFIQYFVDPAINLLGGSLVFILTNLTTVLGFVLALLIIRRVFSEKRNPSNFFAWFLLVVFIPVLGVPLYFMFGGRKSRKMAKVKREISKHALDLAKATKTPDPYGAEILALETINHASTGNHFELLPDGVAAFERLCREIENAEHTIHIATYIMGNDATGQRIVELLIRRAQEGVTVRLLLDSLGSWNKTRAARVKVRQAGGQVAMFMPVLPIQTQTSSNLRNHRKIAIFDNYRAITGGQNIDLRFMSEVDHPELFTDFSVITQGPAVAELTRTFLGDWAFAAKEDPAQHIDLLRYIPEEAGNSTVEVMASGPDVPNDPLWEQIVRIIQEFKQSLTIVTPYFIPDEVILRSLIVKAHTGRHIRLILPLHSNQSLADIARHSYLSELEAAGVEILFYTPRMLHAKLILADGKIALIGSANIDMRSLFVNFEIAVLHYSAKDIERLNDWCERIVAECVDYKKAIQEKDLMPSKLKQDIVRLLAPLL
jgi:cardiolipin synthase